MKRHGYTLFELLVVITIIILFTGISLAYYNSFNEQKRLETETKKFVETLELAKKKTISGDKPCDAYNGAYSVEWQTATYKLISSGCAEQLSYNLPAGITFLAASSLTFRPFGLGTTPDCAVVKNNNAGKCRKVTIESSGTITEIVNPSCSCP